MPVPVHVTGVLASPYDRQQGSNGSLSTPVEVQSCSLFSHILFGVEGSEETQAQL